MNQVGLVALLLVASSCSSDPTQMSNALIQNCWGSGPAGKLPEIRVVGLAPERRGGSTTWIARSDQCFGLNLPVSGKVIETKLGLVPAQLPFRMALVRARPRIVVNDERMTIALDQVSALRVAQPEEAQAYYDAVLRLQASQNKLVKPMLRTF